VWSLPGGHIEPGEAAADAARREVLEETAIEAEILGLVDTNDVVIRGGDGELMAHYLIVIHFGRWVSGSPIAGDDCVDARFISLDRLGDFKTTDRLAHFIAKAHQRFKAHGHGLD
jgi:8-oxo-dGTP diphosphatase